MAETTPKHIDTALNRKSMSPVERLATLARNARDLRNKTVRIDVDDAEAIWAALEVARSALHEVREIVASAATTTNIGGAISWLIPDAAMLAIRKAIGPRSALSTIPTSPREGDTDALAAFVDAVEDGLSWNSSTVQCLDHIRVLVRRKRALLSKPVTEANGMPPGAYIDEHGAWRAPDGYAFESVDVPGFDASGYPRKAVKLVPLLRWQKGVNHE